MENTQQISQKDLALEHCINETKKYFQEEYSYSLLETTGPKGRQIGGIFTFNDKEHKKIKYYVKTHSAGLSISLSNSKKARNEQKLPKLEEINPLEILIYKFLELINYGPEVDFFCPEKNDLFIATKFLDNFTPATKFKSDKTYPKNKKTVDAFSKILCVTDLNEGNWGIANNKLIILDFQPMDCTNFTFVSEESKKEARKEFKLLNKQDSDLFISKFQEAINFVEQKKDKLKLTLQNLHVIKEYENYLKILNDVL